MISTKKGRKELIEKYCKKQSKILSIDCFRKKNPAEVKIIYKDSTVETIQGPLWAIILFYKDFRKKVLNIYI